MIDSNLKVRILLIRTEILNNHSNCNLFYKLRTIQEKRSKISKNKNFQQIRIINTKEKKSNIILHVVILDKLPVGMKKS